MSFNSEFDGFPSAIVVLFLIVINEDEEASAVWMPVASVFLNVVKSCEVVAMAAWI